MIEELESEYQRNPDSIEANCAIAEYYISHDAAERAEPYLIKALELDEGLPSIHNQLGMVYLKQSRHGMAEHHFRRALQLDFAMTEAHFNLAFLYQTQQKFEEALPYYKEVVNSNPDDAEVYRLMGQCAQSAGMMQESEAFFAESFRLTPTIGTAMDLSILYISAEKYPEAEQLLEWMLDVGCSISDDPDSDVRISESDQEHLRFTMALVLANQGKRMEAMRHLRDIIELDDQNEQAFYLLGECCVAAGLRKEAKSFFAKASKLDPQYLQPIIHLGELHYSHGEFYKAIAALEQYLKVKGELKTAQGQEDEEKRDAETELAYGLLGKSYLQIGEKERAMEVWEKSLAMNPDQPELVSLIQAASGPAYRRTSLSIEE